MEGSTHLKNKKFMQVLENFHAVGTEEADI